MTKPSANSSSSNSNSSSGQQNSTNDNKKPTDTSNSTTNTTNNNNNNNNNDPTNGNQTSETKKPRRSIKVEGNCLHNMLKEGYAKITDASRLGKRLSSEIWSSFGAIQVPENFSNPAIQTKSVADGPTTVKICHYFVACGRCFSVFKYDGHAYGTTGLVKHLKNCHGSNIHTSVTSATINSTQNSNVNTSNVNNSDGAHNSGVSLLAHGNGPISTFTKRKRTRTISLSQPSVKSLVRAIEDLRSEQSELKQKIQEVLNIMNSNCMGQIQIITNEGDKSETFQSTN